MAKLPGVSLEIKIDHDAANKQIAEIAEKFGILQVSLNDFCETVNRFNLDVKTNKKED